MEKNTSGMNVTEAAHAHVQEVIDAIGHPGWNWETQDVVDGFKAGAKWQRQAFLSILDKWEKHAIHGMEVGATAYHQGKVALITDLRDWIEEYEVDENEDEGGAVKISRRQSPKTTPPISLPRRVKK